MNRVVHRAEQLESKLAIAEKRAAAASIRAKCKDAPIDDLKAMLATVRDRRLRRERSIPDDENHAVTVLCERDFATYCQEAWSLIEPAALAWNWHHTALCNVLEAVTAGHIRRLLVNMPPRHTKSTICAVLYPAWVWVTDPAKKFLTASHSHDLAVRDCGATRRLSESKWFQDRWPHVKVMDDEAAKERYKLTSGGGRIAGSPTGVSTGDGGDILIGDDLLKIDARFSEPIRRGVNQWVSETLLSRLNDPQTGKVILIGQRLHERDVFGELLAQGGWTHLNFVTEYEPSRRCTINVPGFSWDGDPRKESGELLWPQRFGPPEIEQIKKCNTPSGYAALYQQRPTPAGGGRFKEEWFRDLEMRETSSGWEFLLFNPDGVRVVKQSDCKLFGPVDPASAEKTTGNKPCYTVMLAVAATAEKDVLIFDIYRRNAPAPEVLDAMQTFKDRNRLELLIAEKNGLGLPIVQMAIANGITVKPVDAVGNKESRAEAAEIHARNGKVYILRNAPWRNEFLSELELFPAGEFADQVDAFSHGVRHVNFGPWIGGPVVIPNIPQPRRERFGVGYGSLNRAMGGFGL
jgi:predicted phage terminase large subunit-like protein